jgi:hypothetical protein
MQALNSTELDRTMNDAAPLQRHRGRPRTPPETHRRTITVRLRPRLLQRLKTAAVDNERSLSQEIEWRCQLYEDLLASGNGPIKLLLAAACSEADWPWSPEHTIGSLASVLLRLPHHGKAEEGDEE